MNSTNPSQIEYKY